MQISLDGKRAFITGGGAGMGRATAIAMQEAGASVHVCDIDEAALATMPEGIETSLCDVADSGALDRVLDALIPVGLDFMINNAGIAGPTKPVSEITDDEWRNCMAVGIDSAFYCARRVAPLFSSQRSGVIINMISSAGLHGFPMRSPYAAAKWALVGFTKTLAMELGPDNVRVNGVAPGNVIGERMERVIDAHARAEAIDPDTVRTAYTMGTSMRCWVEADEIAALNVYLCSDHGRHISGQIIGVDGNTETLHPLV